MNNYIDDHTVFGITIMNERNISIMITPTTYITNTRVGLENEGGCVDVATHVDIWGGDASRGGFCVADTKSCPHGLHHLRWGR